MSEANKFIYVAVGEYVAGEVYKNNRGRSDQNYFGSLRCVHSSVNFALSNCDLDCFDISFFVFV